MAELSDSTELPPGEPLTPVEPKPIQFRLQHLFVAMIWIGITLGLSQFEFGDSGFRATGLHRVFGSLLLSFGLAIIWLNAFGWFESSQTRNWTILWTGFGAMLFVVSLVLPAIAVFGYTMGWEVALDTLEVFYAETEPLESRFYYGCMAVSNVLILLSPLVAWHRDKRNIGAIFINLFGSVAMPALSCAFFFVAIGHVGFYFWLASHMTMFVAFRFRLISATIFTVILAGWIILLIVKAA